MDDEKLILLIKERKEIYDKSNLLYRCMNRKRKAWSEIARLMGLSVKDCMRRWSSLRDRFNREYVKGDKTFENNGRSYIAHLFPLMDFIRPHISSRPQRMRPTIPSCLKRKRSPPPPPISESDQSPNPSPGASPVNGLKLTEIFDDPLNDPSLLRKICKFPSNPNVDKSFCEAVEALKKYCTPNDAKSKNAAVHAFGEMIISTICSMNRRNQVKAMQQVTDLVMRIKLDEDEAVQEFSYSI